MHRCAISLLIAWIAAVTLHTAVDAAPYTTSSVLNDLANDYYRTRKAASRRLLLDTDVTIEELALLWTSATSQEQRHRLIDVARHHYLRKAAWEKFTAPRAASIGVVHEAVTANEMPGLDQPAVIVMRTMPGLPAYSHLEPGDVITALDGKPLLDGFNHRQISEHFQQMIRNHRPGTIVQFSIMRHGSAIEIPIPLASHDALSAMYQLDARLTEPFSNAWQKVRTEMFYDARPQEPLAIDWPANVAPQLNQQEDEQ